MSPYHKVLKQENERKAQIGRTLIEIPGVGIFKMVDVDGDGNCFFSALCASPEIRVKDPWELRQALVEFLENNLEATSIYTNVLKEREPYEAYIRKLRKNGSWAGTSAAVFMCMMYGVNIVITSNTKAGLICNDIREWENIDFIEESALTIYLYHHLYKKPFTKSKVCNHFAYLFHYEGQGNPEETYEIYRNALEKSIPLEVVLNSEDTSTANEIHRTKRQKKHDNKDDNGVENATTEQKRIKTKKQSVLLDYLFKMKVDDQEVQKLNDRQLSAEHFQGFEIQREVQYFLLRLVDRPRYIGARRTKMYIRHGNLGHW